ncbi:hypothetical protein PILCRDRAFT_811301 [Piloderma croceum F 1598]|uniref:MARVEL domain-containing protein n=1 Tax=Piloderma croceum (strain F 1598) TaxID=765440 RepID=A0A0C3BW84_PILCF|nr:hypothetical protein PILCRDRAFT_811301 [Piloderma croceum F 1598]
MPSAFNIARAAIYATVLLWTIICLAVDVHLHGLLATSDLTRFIPFAIFVCSASLIIMLSLLGFTLMRERSPISTRIELGCLGLAGTFWLSLGAFLATSDSESADVECFASAGSTSDVIDMPGFSSDTYHAMYRVLEAFSLFNTILVWGFLVFLSALVLRQHFMGHRSMWYCAVTSYPWFGKGKGSGLPNPVASRSRSRGRSIGARKGDRYSVWKPRSHRAPVHAHLATDKYDKYKRGASPRR